MEEYVLAMGQPVPSAVVKDARTMPFREEFASDMVQRYIVKSRVMKDVPHFYRDAGCATGMISTKSVLYVATKDITFNV